MLQDVLKKVLFLFLSLKFPLVRQYDQIDCGPATLLSILKYYGGNTSLARVRDLCKTDQKGSTMLDMVNAAKSLGINAYGATGEFNDLLKEQMPCIAHIVKDSGLNHYIIIYKISSNTLLIGDPGKGLQKIHRDEFLLQWQKKAVILLEPTSYICYDPQSSNSSWILKHLKQKQGWIYQTLFLGIVFSLLGLLTAVFVQQIIDQFIPEENVGKILISAIMLLFLSILRIILGYIRERFLIFINMNVNLSINNEFLNRIFRLPLHFFNSRKIGDLTARINDSIKIQQAILLLMNTTIIDGFIILFSIALVFYFNTLLGLLSVIIVPVYFMLLFSKSNKIHSLQNDVMRAHAVVESTYIDTLSGIDEVKSFNAHKTIADLNFKTVEQYQKSIKKLRITQANLSMFVGIESVFVTISFLAVGASLVIHNQVLLGQMMASFSLLSNILISIGKFVNAQFSVQGALIASNRLADILDVSTEINKGQKKFEFENELRFQKVNFSWPKSSLLFKDISLVIEKGKLTSLWGPSGSGKSTLIKLIERKYALTSGSILIDQTNISQIDLYEYRKHISIIPQKIKIFNTNLLNNITLGRSFTNSDEIIEKIDRMGLTNFINDFYFGLETQLGEEGQNLSGGEIQLVGLIRALYNSPKILIIDEGLNSLDIEYKVTILKILKSYAQNNIVFIVTHDINTLLYMDYCYLLKNRTINEQGSPTALLNSVDSYLNRMHKSLTFNRFKETLNEQSV